jgi:peroxiredoxin Q/BCP
VLGVSFDDQQANAKFADKFHFPFPLLCDTDRKIGLAYGAAASADDQYAKRIAYVIDENGRIQEAHEKVSAGSYPHEQLERLQAAKL